MAEPETTAVSVETTAELGDVVTRWRAELASYDRHAEEWLKECDDIVSRFMLRERYATAIEDDTKSKFNVLWSNTEIQIPTVFSQAPMPHVRRRFRDKDMAARMASMMLERGLSTDLEFDEIEFVADRLVLDYLLCGRAVPWVSYAPITGRTRMLVKKEEAGNFNIYHGESRGQMIEPVDSGEVEDNDDGTFSTLYEELVDQRAPVEYLHYRDFAHKPVKTWMENSESGWVARRHYFTRRQIQERFGDQPGIDIEKIPLTATPTMQSQQSAGGPRDDPKGVLKMAEVWEIWDAVDRMVVWICKDYQDMPLKQEKDPLHLVKFFPCPRPAFGTISNNSLIPTPEFEQYRHLAVELDDLTDRISALTDEIVVKGIYDQSAGSLSTLINTKTNKLIGVDMAVYLARSTPGQGLRGVIQFWPIEIIAGALMQLYDVRDRVKQVIYEVTGLSDVMRGTVDPREKATQTRLKGQFATARTDRKRVGFATMLRDVVRIKVEIMAEHFSDAMLREISGFDHISEIERILAETGPQGEQGAGEEKANQIFAAAVALIRNDRTRGFRVEVETEDTANMDEQSAKDSAVEFMTAFGGILEKALPLVQISPKFMRMIRDLTMFALRRFKVGRSVEASIEETLEQVEEEAQQKAAKPPPDPEAQKAQAEAQMLQQKAQTELQMAQQKGQIEMQLKMLDIQLKEREGRLKLMLLEAQVKGKVEGAEIDIAVARQDLENEIQAIQNEGERLEIERQALDVKREGVAVQREAVEMRRTKGARQ